MAKGTKSRAAPTTEARVNFPPQLLEVFARSPRVLIKHRPDGLWPIDPGMLVGIDWKKLAKSRSFNRDFEVVIMPKAGQ